MILKSPFQLSMFCAALKLLQHLAFSFHSRIKPFQPGEHRYSTSPKYSTYNINLFGLKKERNCI